MTRGRPVGTVARWEIIGTVYVVKSNGRKTPLAFARKTFKQAGRAQKWLDQSCDNMRRIAVRCISEAGSEPVHLVELKKNRSVNLAALLQWADEHREQILVALEGGLLLDDGTLPKQYQVESPNSGI